MSNQKSNQTSLMRNLTGEAAKKLYEQQGSEKLAPKIGSVKFMLLDLRYKLLARPSNEKPSYYLVRHRYSQQDRFLLDFAGLGLTREDSLSGKYISLGRYLRYKWYYLKYWNYIHKKPSKWVRATSSSDKNPQYVLREDLLKEDPDFGKNTIRWNIKRNNLL